MDTMMVCCGLKSLTPNQSRDCYEVKGKKKKDGKHRGLRANCPPQASVLFLRGSYRTTEEIYRVKVRHRRGCPGPGAGPALK
jgi:hypothetical protein